MAASVLPLEDVPVPVAPAEEMSFREIGERLHISHELARLDFTSAMRKLQTIGFLLDSNDPDYITDEELGEIAVALGITAQEALARYISEMASVSKLTDALHMDNVRTAPHHYPIALRNRLRRFEEVADDMPDEFPVIPLPDGAEQGEQQ